MQPSRSVHALDTVELDVAGGGRPAIAPPVGADGTLVLVLTFGHGTATREQLVELVQNTQIGLVVDVRRFPGSRRSPHVSIDAMQDWLPEAGVAYRWEPRLGGRRRLVPDGDPDGDPHSVADSWWRVPAFRAYAAHTRSSEFRAGLQALLSNAVETDRRVAIMCSESLWWRCHRRLIADVLVLVQGIDVHHLSHDGRLVPHVPSAGARISDDGLRYEGTS